MRMHACLQFVLGIDNILFTTFGTAQIKQLLEDVDELPVRRRHSFQGLDGNAVITFASLLGLLAVFGVTAIIPHVNDLRDVGNALCGTSTAHSSHKRGLHKRGLQRALVPACLREHTNRW